MSAGVPVSFIVLILLIAGGVPAQELPEDGAAADPLNAADAADGPPDRDTRLPPDAIEPAVWPRSSAIYPAPDPFSVNYYDARLAAAMIRRERLLIRRVGSGREIVPVRTIEIRDVGTDERLPETHRRRYDLVLNGDPLPWDELYIEYGGRLLNMQLLFTYRNQRPVPDQ
ncbi:MAG: hypothetical protein ACOCYQ_09340, partial [Alkalispirochaeta sp.]